MLGTRNSCGDLMEQVEEFARQEAEALASFAERRLIRQNHEHRLWTSTDRVVRRARQLAEALVCGAGDPLAADAAGRVWARVRALLMNYTPGWSVEEFIIFHVTRDEYGGFPYGLAASDLTRLADGAFPAAKIRSAMTRLARKGLIGRCEAKRRSQRRGMLLPVAEHVWFYAGPTSRYSEHPDAVRAMHSPGAERPPAARTQSAA